MKITQLLPTTDKGASPERMPSREVEAQFPPEVLARVREVFVAANNVEVAKRSMGLVEAPVQAKQEIDQQPISYPDITGPGYTELSNDAVEAIKFASRELARPASEMRGGVDAYNQAA